MPKHLIPGVVFQPGAYQRLQKGINQMVNLVRPTLGPRPRAVAVENVSREKMPELLDNAGLITRRIIQLRDGLITSDEPVPDGLFHDAELALAPDAHQPSLAPVAGQLVQASGAAL